MKRRTIKEVTDLILSNHLKNCSTTSIWRLTILLWAITNLYPQNKEVLLFNEVLHKPKRLGRDLLLKLDTIKASDCMSWEFLILLLEKIGMGPYFINMVIATNSTTSSTMLIEGKLSTHFKLKRSARHRKASFFHTQKFAYHQNM